MASTQISGKAMKTILAAKKSGTLPWPSVGADAGTGMAEGTTADTTTKAPTKKKGNNTILIAGAAAIGLLMMMKK